MYFTIGEFAEYKKNAGLDFVQAVYLKEAAIKLSKDKKVAIKMKRNIVPMFSKNILEDVWKNREQIYLKNA